MLSFACLRAQIPQKLASDAFHRFHHNPDGLLQRDAISCRLEHPQSTIGGWTAGFSTRTGNPVARVGYHVPCTKDSDCYRMCPRHPMTGNFYRCATQFKLFDAPLTSGDFLGPSVDYLNYSTGTNNAFDVQPGQGVCVDTDYRMFQGCPEEIMAKVVDGLVGCADRPVSYFLCGLEMHAAHGDPGEIAIKGNYLYPRTLIGGGQDMDGDGSNPSAFTCGDPVDCNQKCRYLARTSVNGMGTPPSCALCGAQPCTFALTTSNSTRARVRRPILSEQPGDDHLPDPRRPIRRLFHAHSTHRKVLWRQWHCGVHLSAIGTPDVVSTRFGPP